MLQLTSFIRRLMERRYFLLAASQSWSLHQPLVFDDENAHGATLGWRADNPTDNTTNEPAQVRAIPLCTTYGPPPAYAPDMGAWTSELPLPSNIRKRVIAHRLSYASSLR